MKNHQHNLWDGTKMLKKKKPETITFTCRRCHATVVDTAVSRYCTKCEKIVREAFAHRQGKKHGK